MAKSLAKINEQIAKLQREADSIQSTVITRIKKEIAQHGLTSEHLFGQNSGTASSGLPSPKPKKAATAKAAKFADTSGNTWHGIGKRPQWIHDAIASGRELADFLIGAAKPTPVAKKAAKTASKAPKVAAAASSPKKATPAKKQTKRAKAPAAAEAAPAAPAKRTRAPAAKKSGNAAPAAKKARPSRASKVKPAATSESAPAAT